MSFERSLYCFFISITSIFFLSSCAEGWVIDGEKNNVTAELPVQIEDDTEYMPVLEKWKRKIQLYSLLELNFSGYVILMSPEMTDAYLKRLSKIQGETAKPDEHLISSKDTVVIFMDVFASNPPFREFEDPKIWTLTLRYHGKVLAPDFIYRYRNLAETISYFPQSSTWSKTYAIRFKLPKDRDWKTNKDNSIVFVMKSGETHSESTW